MNQLLYQLERYVALHEGDCVEVDEESTLLEEARKAIAGGKGCSEGCSNKEKK
jgi:hypothetical protein